MAVAITFSEHYLVLVVGFLEIKLGMGGKTFFCPPLFTISESAGMLVLKTVSYAVYISQLFTVEAVS